MGAHLGGSAVLIRKESRGNKDALIIYHDPCVCFPWGGVECERHHFRP